MKNPYIYDKPEELQKNIDLITELIQKNENVLRKNNAKLQGAYNEVHTEGESDFTEEQDSAGAKTYQTTDSLKAVLRESLKNCRYGNQSPNYSYINTEAKKTGIRQTITQGIMLILCLIILLIFVVIGCSLMIVRSNHSYELSMAERAQCDLNAEQLQQVKSAFEKVATSIGKI